MKNELFYMISANFVSDRRHIFMTTFEDQCSPLVTRDLDSARGFILVEIAKAMQKQIKNPIEVFFRIKALKLKIHKIAYDGSLENMYEIINKVIKNSSYASQIDTGQLPYGPGVKFVVSDCDLNYIEQFDSLDYEKNIIKEFFY